MAESGLDLRAMEAEIAQYVAAGGRWLLVVERVPELLEHVRALRAALAPLTVERLEDALIDWFRVVFYQRHGWLSSHSAEACAADVIAHLRNENLLPEAVLRGAQDPEGP